MPEVKSEKFLKAQECLMELLPELRRIYEESLGYDITIHVSRVDEERGVIILSGSKGDGGSLSPFILREPALSHFEKIFKGRLPWVTRVVDSTVLRMEQLADKLGLEINSRQITG